MPSALEVQVLMTLHRFHGNVYILRFIAIITRYIFTITGPISSEIKMLPRSSKKQKDQMIKDFKESIEKVVAEDRNFVRQTPTLFYAEVSDFRFDLFRSSNLFALSTPVDESATPDLTGETEEEKLYREDNEMHERLNAIFSF